eukprot:2778308-Amphidinium_carterae.1
MFHCLTLSAALRQVRHLSSQNKTPRRQRTPRRKKNDGTSHSRGGGTIGRAIWRRMKIAGRKEKKEKEPRAAFASRACAYACLCFCGLVAAMCAAICACFTALVLLFLSPCYLLYVVPCRFYDVCFPSVNERVLYHQTSPEVAAIILQSGIMHCGESGLAGGGIYFAETPEHTNHKAKKRGAILECRVSLGRVKKLSAGGDSRITYGSLRRERRDSVCIARSNGL